MILEYYLKSMYLYTLLLIACIIFFKIFNKRYQAITKYFVWNIFSIAFLIPSNIFSSYLINQNLIINNSETKTEFLNNLIMKTNEIGNNLMEFTEINKPINNFSFPSLFFKIWILGGLLFLMYNIIGYLTYKNKLFKTSVPVSDYFIIELLNEIRRKLNVHSEIKIRYSILINSPMLISCSNPTIFLPYRMDNKHLKCILEHEIIHFKFFDLWYQRIRLLVTCLFWFNPVIHLFCRIAENDMEKACDFRVINNNVEKKKKYAEAIYHVISLRDIKGNQSLSTNFNKKSTIIDRMEHIMNKKIRKNGIFIVCLIVLCLLFVNVMSINMKPIKAENIAEEDASIVSNTYVPLEETMEQLGYKIILSEEKTISFQNKNNIVNFVDGFNYNLKKNNNTYYAKNIDSILFIKIAVLENLGYKIVKNGNKMYANLNSKNVKLDTEVIMKIMNAYPNSRTLDESNKNYFYNLDIVKDDVDIASVSDYAIEDLNIMNYKDDELSEYIMANYNMSVNQYKDSLIELKEKYPEISIISYKLLSNGQVIVKFTNNGQLYMELAMELKNNKFFIEK